MEGKTHFEVVGGNDYEKEATIKSLQALFERRDKRLAENEIEKTPEDLQIINNTIAVVDDIVSKYGGDKVEVPLDNIYIIQPRSFSKISEGKFLNGIHKPFDKIVSSSKGKFTSRDEVFEHFARANFSGKYLPLARMVEDILGKGSFRKIAEDFSTEPK